MPFSDRYQIISKIGEGGFGTVYKAIDLQQGHLVAIKEVNLQGLSPKAISEATSTFNREVSLLSNLVYPGLPRIYEHFRESDHLYLVMDFIKGETLETYLEKAQNRRLLLSEALDIGLQLCTILDYLHSQHPPIIFRDLKPANIMRTPEGRIYLIDFGIARHFQPGKARDTIALGSPGYAAPEQYGKAQTTPHADIYSLGAVLYQLLTGRDPSESPFRFSPLRPGTRQGRGEVGSLNTSMIDIELNSLERLIMSMVAMDVNKRPTSITTIKQSLQCTANVWSDITRSYLRRVPRPR